MASFTNTKDPQETNDYGFDWSSWLDTGDTIASQTWTCDTGITEVSESLSGSQTAVMVSGGEVNNVYTLANAVTTTDGRVGVRRISLYCLAR